MPKIKQRRYSDQEIKIRHRPPEGSTKHGLYLIARPGEYKIGCGDLAKRLWEQGECEILGLFSTGDTKKNFELERRLHDELKPGFDHLTSEWFKGCPPGHVLEMFSTQRYFTRRPHGNEWEPCEVGKLAELGVSSGRDSLRIVV